MLVKLSLAAVLAASSVHAFFKMPFDNIMVTERSDPLVSPGTYSAHVHQVFGGSNFGPSSTYEDLRKSECTSARAVEDKSAYWTPQLYFQWANGSFTAVPSVGGGALIYYLFRDHPTDKYPIQAFPAGFRMLTGDPTQRTYYQTGNMKDAIGWNCLGSASPTRVEGSGLPVNKYCSGNLRGEIRFPSCWDGKQNYTTDGSHVAYSAGEAGPCPSTHPHRIPTLFYEINYYVQAMEPYRQQALNPKQPFVLAMGDATGQGWHGDFQNGWHIPTLQSAIETCLSPTDGGIDLCPVLKQYDRSVDGQKSCKRTTIWNERVLGATLAKLPGCNAITTTRAAAVAQMAACKERAPSKLASKPTTYFGDVPPAGTTLLSGDPTFVTSAYGYKYSGCYFDSQAKRTFSKQITTAKKTVADCLTAARTAGYGWAAQEYGGECWVSKTAPTSKKLDDGSCSMPCTDRPSNYCGGAGAMAVYSSSTVKKMAKRHLESATASH
ncbi:hypothetical protein JCM8547_000066 [Rhodosporidiobolus lusitaniae]